MLYNAGNKRQSSNSRWRASSDMDCQASSCSGCRFVCLTPLARVSADQTLLRNGSMKSGPDTLWYPERLDPKSQWATSNKLERFQYQEQVGHTCSHAWYHQTQLFSTRVWKCAWVDWHKSSSNGYMCQTNEHFGEFDCIKMTQKKFTPVQRVFTPVQRVFTPVQFCKKMQKANKSIIGKGLCPKMVTL